MENQNKVDFVEQFQKRTKKFVVDNIKLFRKLPNTEEARIVGRQLLRSSSSVGANYRAACRARSQAEFHSKLSIVVEEADESVFWMEILEEAEIIGNSELSDLTKEANEILKVLSKARKTISEKK
ncbi:four helix bundle protein [Mucilaginibacter gracilis]|uniref:Four helix bundle protein n=1 Tax=Mucilaginibacter gracilis TaxID=423350 RepID=A0A495J8M7_9SPHI|nr:four helix bundle protein [Mucilaginibacter gracilis]RKR84754.1 four helix bundle protein [Mucilaginibacter gracilis]